MPYPFAFSARSFTANCFSGGVEYAQRLYSAITPSGALGLGHVLAQDRQRLGAHDEHRAQVADQGREDVRVGPSGEGIGRPDRLPLLTEGAEQAADDLALAVEGGEPLLQGPGEPQVA